MTVKGRGSFETFTAGAAITAGMVVIEDTSADKQVALSTTLSDQRVIGIAAETIASGAVGLIQVGGVVKDALVQGAVTRGRYLRQSATSGRLEDTTVLVGTAQNPPIGACAIALESIGATGAIDVLWIGCQSTPGFSQAPASWTPTWTTDGGGESLGNGTITATFLQIGKFVWFSLRFDPGTTTNFGSGQWRFTLPVATPNAVAVFAGWAFDSSAGLVYACSARIASGSTTSSNAAEDGPVTSLNPFTWASADSYAISGWYVIG